MKNQKLICQRCINDAEKEKRENSIAVIDKLEWIVTGVDRKINGNESLTEVQMMKPKTREIEVTGTRTCANCFR